MTGWHLPNKEEWNNLVAAAGGRDTILYYYRGDGESEKYSLDAGKYLKAQSGWNDYCSEWDDDDDCKSWVDGNGIDTYGFSALPGGYRDYDGGGFDNAGDYGYWWTATEYDTEDSGGYAYYRDVDYDNDHVYEDNYNKSYGFSVRCVQD